MLKPAVLKRAMSALAGASIITATALAQSADKQMPANTPQIITRIEQCRSVSDAAARLACFDDASAGLSGAIESKEIVVVEQKDVVKTKRSLFGFRLPDLSIFGDDGTAGSQQLLTTVAQAAQGKNGRWNITTAEGAVWQTTETVPFLPRSGDELEIKSGALGSYFVKIRGKRAVRSVRVQ